MTHFFPLRQSTQIELSLPLDLTDREARRFAQFVESLAVDDVFPADERDDPWPTYLFPMRRDLDCELDFPPDLTCGEARRISLFVSSLPFTESLPAAAHSLRIPNKVTNGISLGGLLLGTDPRVYHQTRKPTDRDALPEEAIIRAYPLTDGKTFRLEIEEVRFPSGECLIVGGANETGNPYWERLSHGLRLGIVDRGDGNSVARLGLAAPNPEKGRPTRKTKNTLDELDEAAGLDVAETLLDLGALRIGTREEVYGVQNNKKNELCVLYPEDQPMVGLAAYVLTTVLPLLEDAGYTP